MRGLNQIQIIGNVGKDPETHTTEAGNTVVRFSVAINSNYTNKNGEKVEHTEWVNVVAWNKLAEIIAEYVTKGTPLYLSGRIATRSFEKDGVKKYVTEMIADKMIMLGGKKQDESDEPDEVEPAPKKNDLPF